MSGHASLRGGRGPNGALAATFFHASHGPLRRLTFRVALIHRVPQEVSYCASSLLWPGVQAKGLGRLLAELTSRSTSGRKTLPFMTIPSWR